MRTRLFSCHPHASIVVVIALLANSSTSMAGTIPFEFHDAPACRGNLIPLGEPARLEVAREHEYVTVTVLANFGCSTRAGDASVEREGFLFVLSARTILNEGPLIMCKCTRELKYRFHFPDEPVPRGGFRFLFRQDGRNESEVRTLFSLDKPAEGN